MIDCEVENFLAHFGVKGMKWGVRKEREATAKLTKTKVKSEDEDTKREQAVLKKLGLSSGDSERLKAKHEPYIKEQAKEDKKDPFLTNKQKKYLKTGAVVVGAGLVAYGGYKLNKQIKDNLAVFDMDNYDWDAANKNYLESMGVYTDSENFTNFITMANDKKLNTAKGWTKEQIDALSDDGVSLSAGSIVKRISTVKETDVKFDGFYASFDEADVNRYKAVLPVYWKAWGYKAKEGYVVDLKANSDVNAPSPKRTFEMFKEMLGEKVSPEDPNLTFRDVYEKRFGKKQNDTELAQSAFGAFVAEWIDTRGNLATMTFFDKVKSEGYNAVVDINDMGSLANRPMRFLDSSIFSISGHTPLSTDDIKSAQEAILELVHSFLNRRFNLLTFNNF